MKTLKEMQVEFSEEVFSIMRDHCRRLEEAGVDPVESVRIVDHWVKPETITKCLEEERIREIRERL